MCILLKNIKIYNQANIFFWHAKPWFPCSVTDPCIWKQLGTKYGCVMCIIFQHSFPYHSHDHDLDNNDHNLQVDGNPHMYIDELVQERRNSST